MSKTIFIDFETRSVLDLKEVGAVRYAEHESTVAWCLAWGFTEGEIRLWKLGEPSPTDLFKEIEMGAKVVAHNAFFELTLWNLAMHTRHGWPVLPIEQVYCTMTYAYAMALPGSLEKASIAAGIEHKKDMAGNRMMLKLAQPKRMEGTTPIWWDANESPDKFEILWNYCVQDIKVERELYSRLLPLSKEERETWLLDWKINMRGVLVDIPAVQTAIEIVELEKKRLDEEMRLTTDGAVSTCTATGQLKDWLQWQGVETESVAKSDVIRILDSDISDRVRTALMLRQEAAKSSTAKLQAMMNRAASDGRIRQMFQYHGANTGRWAGRGVQLQNLPKSKLEQEQIEDVFSILGKGEL